MRPLPEAQSGGASSAPNRQRTGLGVIKRVIGSIWFRATISVALLVFLITNAGGEQLVQSMRRLDWRFWSLAVAAFLASQVLSAVRWATLGRAVGFDSTFNRYIKLYFEGMFFSLCLPTAIGGDVVKAWRLGETTRGRVLAGCTVLADRLTGLVAILIIGATAMVYQTLDWEVTPALLLVAALVCAGLILIRIGLFIWSRSAKVFERLPAVGDTLVALRPFHDRPGVLMCGVLYSLGVQTLNALTVLLIGAGMGLGLPAEAYFVAVPAAALAALLPSVGGLGVREGALAYMLAQFGLAQELGVSVGVLWSSAIVLGSLTGGIAYLIERRGSPATSKMHPAN